MPKYHVRLPIAGVLNVTVEADDEDAAIKQALEKGIPNDLKQADFDELNVYEDLIEGNVSNAPLDSAEAEEADVEDDEGEED